MGAHCHITPGVAAEGDLVRSLGALAERAWELRPPMPHERHDVLRSEAGLLIDRLLTRVARGRGALDVAVGEGLDALASGDWALRLGYSGIGDYARETLGMAARTAQASARLARELRARPLLREAVRRGEVSPRKAQAVVPLARGEAEAEWVARARSETVRALEAAVRASRAGGGEEIAGADEEGDEERWERVHLPLSPEGRAKLDEALALAGKVLGATAPMWQRLEALCQEFLSAHPPQEEDGEGDQGLRAPVAGWLQQAKAALEEEHRAWAYLGEVPAVVAPVVAGPAGTAEDARREVDRDPRALDARLRGLAAMRDRWDEVLGHLAMLLRMLGLWRDMGFASFGHYCAERLGMAGRTWNSAPGSSASCTRSRSCAARCGRGGSPTRRPASLRAAPTRARWRGGWSAPSISPASPCGARSRRTSRGSCVRRASSSSGCRGGSVCSWTPRCGRRAGRRGAGSAPPTP
jgi:hypothetical protein